MHVYLFILNLFNIFFCDRLVWNVKCSSFHVCCPNCPASALQMGRVTWAVWAIKEYSLKVSCTGHFVVHIFYEINNRREHIDVTH